MRSRTVSRPWSRWRLTLSTPPISRANASRRARSSSSGFQFIRIPRLDDLIVVPRHRQRFSFQPAGEDVAVGALEQAADRSAQFEHDGRHFAVHPLLIEHRRQQPDRCDDEGLVLRAPQRHAATVDVWAPGAKGDDIAVLAQMATVSFEAWLQQ